MNPIDLNIFSSRLEAICDEMGAVLRNAAFSPNIRDRLDFSCAVFDARGELCAQAAHIPVHLGSMAFAMRDVVNGIDWHDGDQLIFNDPYLGGTHLPDVTLIAPLFVAGELVAFAVNRAHHADIGSDTPGSMPISSSLTEEGLVIEPIHLIREDKIRVGTWEGILGAIRNRQDSAGDLSAQISANRAGIRRLRQFIAEKSIAEFEAGVVELNDYAERLARESLKAIPDGNYQFTDVLDDDGQGQKDITIAASVSVQGGSVDVDFSGTSAQVRGNVNCPLSVAAAAVFYVFRCLMPPHTPACAGTFRSIQLTAPAGCLLNARRPAAVAAGNVETSTRVVDVIMGALTQGVPERMAAASYGSMNNVAMGSDAGDRPWDYYETIGGGMGASHRYAGLSGVQAHMTNTLNTPIEVVENRYPLRVRRYRLRGDSAGTGENSGGQGLLREFEFLSPAQFSLLTERRRHRPWGMQNGGQGARGVNRLNNDELPAKCHRFVQPGDVLTIETPGGGGWRA